MQFQKNLVVWKQCPSGLEVTVNNIVSEELSSVETRRLDKCLNMGLSVSEELSSVETSSLRICGNSQKLFQKNLVVWKLEVSPYELYRILSFRRT